ncbi:Boron transporter 1 [Trebouxia sp. C0010 RCD-2024]
MRWSDLRIHAGILEDLQGRAPWYKDDWRQGVKCGYRILAPSTYILFTSAIPAIAFGEQLVRYTDGQVSAVQVLTATAMCGVIQAVVGGQPLLIVGVAEPIVLLYKFMFDFASNRPSLPPNLFLPWCAWACTWTACMLWATAASGACRYIYKFTRFSGELFGMLIATLFLQQAVQGLKEGFHITSGTGAVTGAANDFQWRLVNGLWGLILALGLLWSALTVRKARTWLYFKGWARSLLADYGVPLLVVIWSAVGYCVYPGTPDGVPRQAIIYNTWDVKDNWTVARDMGAVPGAYIAGALVPALIITVLFYFDHSVSSQLAQTPNFNLRKPSAYNWDLFLLGFMTFACGILGIPPVNGVLPQAPMHTRALATLKVQRVKTQLQQVARRHKQEPRSEVLAKMVERAKQLESRAADTLQAVADRESSRPPNGSLQALELLPMKPAHHFDLVRDLEQVLPQEVQEQRLSNLIQSLLVAVCLPLTPLLKFCPVAVLWGYFAYMALDSLPGNQFWQRILLLATDKRQYYKLLREGQVPFVETVQFRVIAAFTLLQFVGLAAVYVVSSRTGIVGVIFPVMIMALVPIRQYIMPRLFSRQTLHALDAAEYEAAPPVDQQEAFREATPLELAELGVSGTPSQQAQGNMEAAPP